MGLASSAHSMPAHPCGRLVFEENVRRSPRLRAISKGFKCDFAAMHRVASSQLLHGSKSGSHSASSGSSHRSINQALPADLRQHLQPAADVQVPAPIPLQVLRSTGVSFCGLAPAELEANKLNNNQDVPNVDTTDD